MHKDSVINKPLGVAGLLIVGEKDKRVPSRSASTYAAMCKMTGLPFEYYSY